MENFINEIGITNTFIILLVLIFVLLILVITFMCKKIYLDKNVNCFYYKVIAVPWLNFISFEGANTRKYFSIFKR